jgi:hypothetical protein
MLHAPSKARFAIQYALAGSIAFAGSAVLLKVGTAIPRGAPGGTPGPALLSYVVAALLILTGALLVVMAATELLRVRSPGRPPR